MGYSREDLFAKAKVEREKQKVQEEANNNFSNEGYEEIVYTAMTLNEGKVVRILGNPILGRKNPTDPKESFISMIKGDNGKKFRCIWPSRAIDPNWLLWKVYDTVMKCSYSTEKDEMGRSIRLYNHAKTHPECFFRVAKNENDNKWESGWRPKCYVNMNVIDRQDPAFHKEKKHSKLISKKASEMGETGKFWFEPGIPSSAYNTVWDDVVEFAGDWQEYDVVIKKIKETPWYKAYNGEDDFKKLPVAEQKLVVIGPLSEEELALDLYDLDVSFKITNNIKIKNRLGDFIKKVDIDFKTSFFPELEKLAAEEEEEFKIAKEAEELKNPSTPEPTKEPTKEVTPKAKPTTVVTPTPRTRTPKKEAPKESSINWEGLIDGTLNGTKYLGIADMTDEEKKLVLSINDDGSFTFSSDPDTVLLNTVSGFSSPEDFHIDPLTGEIF